MRIQSRGYKRDKLYSAVLEQIKAKIARIAEQHDCSKSFVTNTILAEALRIKIDEVYYEDRKYRRKLKKSA